MVEAEAAVLLVAGLVPQMVENRRHSQKYLSSLFSSCFSYSDCTMRQWLWLIPSCHSFSAEASEAFPPEVIAPLAATAA